VIGAVVGEFVTSQNGLGHVVLTATSNFDTVTVFVAIIYLVVIGTAAYALMETCERLTIGWHTSRRVGRARPL
jgi:NitT/TauT family transport system permease protein